MTRTNKLIKIICIVLAATLALAALPAYALAEESSAVASSPESSDEPSSDAPEESSEQPPEESSEQPPEDIVYVTVPDADYGACVINSGYVTRQSEPGKTVYGFLKGVTVNATVHPGPGSEYSAAYADGAPVSFSAGQIVFTAERDCLLTVVFTPGKTVNAEVLFVYDGSLGGEYLTVDGAMFTGGSITAAAGHVLGASLPEGLTAEKAILVYVSGDDDVVLPFGGDTVTLPELSGDVVIKLYVSSSDSVRITLGHDGEGAVSANELSPKKGSVVTFTAVAAEGYVIENATLNGIAVTLIDGNASTDLDFFVTFAPPPGEQSVSLFVDEKAGNGSISFAGYSGSSAVVPFGDSVEIVFTPDYGYVIDRVYINGISTTSVKDNRLILVVNREYRVTVAFKKATYRITAVVSKSYGGSITAVGYTMTDGIVNVDHGGSVTFRFVPDMGHVVSLVKVNGEVIADSRATEYTFSNVTSNNTLAVSFVAEGEDSIYYTVSVDCGPHGTADPGTRIDVDGGDDLIITFLPENGYEVDTVYFDGSPASLTQGKLVLINVSTDHIVQVKFREITGSKPEYIDCASVNWEPSEIVIDISSNTRVAKEVFDRLLTLGTSKRVTFSNGVFDITLPSGAVMTTQEEYTDLSYDTNIDFSRAEAFAAQLTANGVTSLYTIIVPSAAYPSGSVMKISLGSGFSAKTVDCYVFDGNVFIKEKSGVVADVQGNVTVPLYDIRTMVIAVDTSAPANHIVTITCGANGSADPSTAQAVADGGDITVRIFPFDGFMVGKVTVNGEELELNEEAKLNGACELPLTNIKSDTAVEIRFTLMPESNDSKVGLIFLIVIIAIAIVGGGVLFFIHWKQTKY